MKVALEAVHEVAALVEHLAERVEALEAAQKPEDNAAGRGLRLFDWRRRRQPQGVEKSDG